MTPDTVDVVIEDHFDHRFDAPIRNGLYAYARDAGSPAGGDCCFHFHLGVADGVRATAS